MAHSDRFDRRSFLARGASALTTVALASAGGALLDACSSTPTYATVTTPGVGVGAPRRGGALTVGVSSDIDGFLPSVDLWDNSGLIYANSVFDSLAVVAADGSIKPYLAQAITPNADFTVWTVTLRPGIFFHDGSPLTAAVAVANFEALRQSPLTSAAIAPITSVAATGDLEVSFTADEPIVAFPFYLSTQVGYVTALAQLDKSNSTHPIGTGPFIYDSWEPNDHFTVTANPHYWRPGLPYLDRITYKPIVSDQSRLASLQTGTIDLMVSRDPGAIAQLGHNRSYQQVNDLDQTTGEPDMDFIILNTAEAPTSDLTVRQALAYATDSAELARVFGQGITKPASSPFPVGSPYRSPHNGYPAYDLEMAKQLVAQAAPAHGGTLRLGARHHPRAPRRLHRPGPAVHVGEGRLPGDHRPGAADHLDRKHGDRRLSGLHRRAVLGRRPRPQLFLLEPHHGPASGADRPQLLPQQRPRPGNRLAVGPHQQ